MRITPIVTGSRPELAAQEARIVEERGEVSLLYQVLLNSPPVAHGWEQMLSAIRNRNSLPAALRELLILRVAVLNRAPYEFEAHLPHARAAGVAEAAIDAIRLQPLPTDAPLAADERLALELADAMTLRIDVPNELFDRVKSSFDGHSLVDLVATIAAYNMVSRFLVALRIGH